MSTSNRKLRAIIRESLTAGYKSLNMDESKNSEEDCIYSKKCTWELFEEFGLRILQAINYAGDYGVIDRVREGLEDEGWDYDNI